MSDPEGFLREDPQQEDYLDELVGGPEAMQKAPAEVGGFVAGHEVEVEDHSTGATQVAVRNTEQSASPFASAGLSNPNQAKQT